MSDDLNTEQVEIDSTIGATETDLGQDSESSAEVEDATSEPTPHPYDLSDVPEEYRPQLEAKLQEKYKNLESGYTQKYQTLAEERKTVDAQRQAYTDALEAMRGTQTQQQTQQVADPLADADWEMGFTQDGRPVAQVMYEQTVNAFGQLAQYLQDKLGNLSQIETKFTEQQKAEQMNALHSEYGDFDEAALLAAQKQNPAIPLDFLAAKLMLPTVKERATQEAYKNKQTKIGATPIASSGAQTVPSVDVKGMGVAEIWDAAKRGLLR